MGLRKSTRATGDAIDKPAQPSDQLWPTKPPDNAKVTWHKPQGQRVDEQRVAQPPTNLARSSEYPAGATGNDERRPDAPTEHPAHEVWRRGSAQGTGGNLNGNGLRPPTRCIERARGTGDSDNLRSVYILPASLVTNCQQCVIVFSGIRSGNSRTAVEMA